MSSSLALRPCTRPFYRHRNPVDGNMKMCEEHTAIRAPFPSSLAKYSIAVRCCCSVTRSYVPHLLQRSRSSLKSLDSQSPLSHMEEETGRTTHDSILLYSRCSGGRGLHTLRLLFSPSADKALPDPSDLKISALRAHSLSAILMFLSTSETISSSWHRKIFTQHN